MVRAAWSADFASVPRYDGVALRTTADRHVAPLGSGRLCRWGASPVMIRTRVASPPIDTLRPPGGSFAASASPFALRAVSTSQPLNLRPISRRDALWPALNTQ